MNLCDVCDYVTRQWLVACPRLSNFTFSVNLMTNTGSTPRNHALGLEISPRRFVENGDLVLELCEILSTQYDLCDVCDYVTRQWLVATRTDLLSKTIELHFLCESHDEHRIYP